MLTLQAKVQEFVKTRKEAEQLIKAECTAQGLTLTLQEITQAAGEMANEQLKEKATKSTTAALAKFTKYKGDFAPQTFLQVFDAECQLYGITDDSQKIRFFPSLMEGTKAQHAQAELRVIIVWADMRTQFIKLFEVDRNSALQDLKSIQVSAWDIDGYLTTFNQIMAKYPWSTGDQEVLKDVFTNNLPMRTREKMVVDRDTTSYTLQDLQNEAKRTHKALYIMNQTRNNNQGNQNKSKFGDQQQQQQQQEDGNEQKGQGRWNNNQGNKGNNRQQKANILELHDKLQHNMHLFQKPSVLEDDSAWSDDVEDVYAKGDKIMSDRLEQSKLNDELLYVGERLVSLFHRWANRKQLDTCEQVYKCRAIESLAQHLSRQQAHMASRGTQVGGRPPRLPTARQLMSDAERILHRNSGGLSLYDRLARDTQLRKEMIELLAELELVEPEVVQFKALEYGKRQRIDEIEAGDTAMADAEEGGGGRRETLKGVKVQFSGRAVLDKSLGDRYDDDELGRFERYYGAHPKLLEGFSYVRNTERKTFLANVTEKKNDISVKQPITSHVPYVSVLLGGMFKVRAMVDSGSTTTVISSGLLSECWSLKELMTPTNLGFRGVGDASSKYNGILKNLELQLGEGLVTNTHVAVIENPELYLLLGNDVIGGSKSTFQRVAMNDEYSFMTLVDHNMLHVENVHFMRNIEITQLPVTMLSQLECEPDGSVVELFR